MNDKYSVNSPRERHLKLWLYLLPIVGIIPAIWTLYSNKGDRERQKASRISIILLLVWLGLYCGLSLGADRASELLAFRLLYTNALFTTGYFVTCTVLMLRLSKGKMPTLPKIDLYARENRE